jgi:hypothetical protein
MEIRNELADFFIKEEKIPWQNQHAWVSLENMNDILRSSSRILQKENSSSTYFLCHFFRETGPIWAKVEICVSLVSSYFHP